MPMVGEINSILNQISSYVASFSAILSLVFMVITIGQTKKIFYEKC